MKFLNRSGLFVINEGGYFFTFTLQPWNWLRVYIGYGKWHKVFEWGHYSLLVRVEPQGKTFSSLLPYVHPYNQSRRCLFNFLLENTEKAGDALTEEEFEEFIYECAKHGQHAIGIYGIGKVEDK